MRELGQSEVSTVSGGDHWGYEGTDGKVPSYLEQWASNSYQNHDGSWGPGETITSFCYGLDIGPGASRTCVNSDGTKSTETCIEGGLSVSVGGLGLGAKLGSCSTKTKREGTPWGVPK